MTPEQSAARRESPAVEVRHFTDGSVEVVVTTAYGENIVDLRVSPRKGFNDEYAEHEVMFSQRDETYLDRETCMIGSTFRVKVPLSTGEQEEVRRLARRS